MIGVLAGKVRDMFICQFAITLAGRPLKLPVDVKFFR